MTVCTGRTLDACQGVGAKFERSAQRLETEQSQGRALYGTRMDLRIQLIDDIGPTLQRYLVGPL